MQRRWGSFPCNCRCSRIASRVASDFGCLSSAPLRRLLQGHPLCVCLGGFLSREGQKSLPKRSSSGGRHEGVVTRSRQSGPVLTTRLLTTLVWSLSGGEKIDNLGPDAHRGPMGAAGTSIFAFCTPNCAILTQFRPSPTMQRLFSCLRAAPGSQFGELWSKLHSSMCRLRKSTSLPGSPA